MGLHEVTEEILADSVLALALTLLHVVEYVSVVVWEGTGGQWNISLHQEYIQECFEGLAGGCTNRGYGRIPFGIHTRKWEFGMDTVDISSITPYSQAYERIWVSSESKDTSIPKKI